MGMVFHHRRTSLLAVMLLLWNVLRTGAAESPDAFDFAHRIVPILRKHCVECHGGLRHEGDFSINTRQSLLEAGAVVPGDSNASHLIELVCSVDVEERMPKDRPALSLEEVKALRDWVDAGTPWDAGFSFAIDEYEPPLRARRPELPPVREGRANPVDRIIDAYMAEHTLARPARLGDAAFLRRVYLDITGVLPMPVQLHAFVERTDSGKRESVIDDLLEDKHAYAEHWLSFWNDLLRNDYQGTGYIDGGRTQISEWLYRALLENKPFDQFARELISPTPKSEGFIRGIKWRGNVNASQKQEVQFAQNVAQVFLGLNMKCASCHDSFIDRWKLSETYGLAAIYADEPLEINRCDKPTGEMAKAAWLFPELGQIDPAASKPDRLKRLAELMTSVENGRFTRTIVNRIWHRLMGRGLVQPVDAMQTPPWSADLLDFLASHLADEGYDLKQTIRIIATSQAYQSQSVVRTGDAGEKYVFAGPIAKRMTAEEFTDALWQLTKTGPTKPHKSVDAFLNPAEKGLHKTYRAALVASDPMMRSLGRPNREQVVSSRPTMLTTLEALDLSNSELLATTLSRGASNILKEFDDRDPSELVTWLYEAALSRSPTAAEREIANSLLGEHPTEQGLEDALWIIIMLPEYQIIR
jgi:hypothetical protein